MKKKEGPARLGKKLVKKPVKGVRQNKAAYTEQHRLTEATKKLPDGYSKPGERDFVGPGGTKLRCQTELLKHMLIHSPAEAEKWIKKNGIGKFEKVRRARAGVEEEKGSAMKSKKQGGGVKIESAAAAEVKKMEVEPKAAGPMGLCESLRMIKKLHDDGLYSAEEFKAYKDELTRSRLGL